MKRDDCRSKVYRILLFRVWTRLENHLFTTMEHLANAFSVLQVDVEDDDDIRGASSTSKPSTEDTGDSSGSLVFHIYFP